MGKQRGLVYQNLNLYNIYIDILGTAMNKKINTVLVIGLGKVGALVAMLLGTYANLQKPPRDSWPSMRLSTRFFGIVGVSLTKGMDELRSIELRVGDLPGHGFLKQESISCVKFFNTPTGSFFI